MNYRIPFHKPFTVGKELDYIAQAVRNGHIAGDAAFTRKCQALLEHRLSAEKVFLTHSCTAALEMSALLCEIAEGDEVILPSFTFVSTANAFYRQKAILKFVDIRTDNLNIDETKVADVASDGTKVIVPVHYAGVACEMAAILDIAQRTGSFVIEDAALSMNAKYHDQYVGTLGDFGALSFHETKSVISGEGGALIINNTEFTERAEIIREKGTNRSKFLRGEIDKYTWVDVGSSYLPSDMISAFLYAQLESMDKISLRCADIFNYYYTSLLPLSEEGHLRLPSAEEKDANSSHLFYILLENEATRDALQEYLKSKSILAVFHYLPLHLSRIGRKLGYEPGQLPVTEEMSACLLRLPFYYELKQSQQEEVVSRIAEFFKRR
jgi:dTDP-4-amino-4,6-dideoxygalactose transaminase